MSLASIGRHRFAVMSRDSLAPGLLVDLGTRNSASMTETIRPREPLAVTRPPSTVSSTDSPSKSYLPTMSLTRGTPTVPESL